MSDPVVDVFAFAALALIGLAVLAVAAADAVRDSDWWVIVRGRTSGRLHRLRHFVRSGRRG
ncbi:hypothetical protein ACH347_31720 [Saccharopolyspora sp. 5N102]|uniref:hypothetical protein n=1 Tax=Saccharopolyspora sp. 5N102 TaxID=3375155 RepID=UPI0037BE1A13